MDWNVVFIPLPIISFVHMLKVIISSALPLAFFFRTQLTPERMVRQLVQLKSGFTERK
jgi:ABC-type phosphate/phosphonate transport system permease subunit